MILYCWNCRGNHEIETEDVERILYTLQGMYADAAISEAEKNEPHDYIPCLKDTATDSHDSEGYAEWTGQLVEMRGKAVS